nr:phosphopantothenoylcysteine decarboxylase [Synergistales bacterium]
GFAAESTDLLENARKKLARKNMDYIILNDIAAGEKSGFQSDDNTVTVISRSGDMLSLSGTKEEVAYHIWDMILSSKERPGIFG